MIAVDISEPKEVDNLLRPAVEFYRTSLNASGYADYVFTDVDGVLRQVEREKTSTILHNCEAVEQEIKKHYDPKGITLLIVEGIAIPHPDGCLTVEVVGSKVRELYFSKTRYEALAAWLLQIQEYGIEVILTPSLEASIIAITSIYWNLQKPSEEHRTFRRYKPIIPWHPNPQVASLMGLYGAGVGEKKAEQLITYFRSIKNIANASVQEIAALPGWGIASARRLLNALGGGDENAT